MNYASNARWIAWNDEALRRLLNGSELMTSDTFALPTTRNHAVPFPTPTPPSKPNAWFLQQGDIGGVVTPTVFETKQNMLNNIPLYEHVNEGMALEENILDFQEVSNHDLKLTTNYETKLTLQRVEESRQEYTRDFCHHC